MSLHRARYIDKSRIISQNKLPVQEPHPGPTIPNLKPQPRCARNVLQLSGARLIPPEIFVAAQKMKTGHLENAPGV